MPGTTIVVEYDPASQWYAVATTIAAHYLHAGSRALYVAMARPRETIVKALTRLGIDVAANENSGLLRIDDWYSASLSPEQSADQAVSAVDDRYLRITTVKVADLSLHSSKELRGQSTLSKWGSEQIGALTVGESFSMLLRFNEEKTFLEWFESRDLPLQRKVGRISLMGFARGVHSDSFYGRIESATEGLIDVRVIEREDEAGSFLRVRNLKDQPHDARWHKIEIKPNGEALLVS